MKFLRWIYEKLDRWYFLPVREAYKNFSSDKYQNTVVWVVVLAAGFTIILWIFYFLLTKYVVNFERSYPKLFEEILEFTSTLAVLAGTLWASLGAHLSPEDMERFKVSKSNFEDRHEMLAALRSGSYFATGGGVVIIFGSIGLLAKYLYSSKGIQLIFRLFFRAFTSFI